MCENCEQTRPLPSQSASKRLRLWEFTDNAHCPVIGTCLNHTDLLTLAKRLKLKLAPDIKDYDLHGFFVSASTMDSPEARAIHKLLDKRHEGALRKFSRLNSRDEQFALWEEMKDGGHIAPAFYAVMTLRMICSEVRATAFAEVHMLSHLLGATHRQDIKESALLREQLLSEQKKRERIEKSFHSTLAKREQRIVRLEQQLIQASAESASGPIKTVTEQKGQRSTAKLDRALQSARSRARIAEAEARSLQTELDRAKRLLARTGSRSHKTNRTAIDGPTAIRLDGQSILYIGGLESQVAHIRKIAEHYGANFIHHDGGTESAPTRIDAILPSVDCVLCPISCVSHDACLRAKSACKKHGKRFIPLRNASQASFRMALEGVGRENSQRHI